MSDCLPADPEMLSGHEMAADLVDRTLKRIVHRFLIELIAGNITLHLTREQGYVAHRRWSVAMHGKDHQQRGPGWHGRTRIGAAIVAARAMREIAAARGVLMLSRCAETPAGAILVLVLRWLPRPRRGGFNIK